MWLAPNVVCVVVQLLVVVCSDGWSEARPSLVCTLLCIYTKLVRT